MTVHSPQVIAPIFASRYNVAEIAHQGVYHFQSATLLQIMTHLWRYWSLWKMLNLSWLLPNHSRLCNTWRAGSLDAKLEFRNVYRGEIKTKTPLSQKHSTSYDGFSVTYESLDNVPWNQTWIFLNGWVKGLGLFQTFLWYWQENTINGLSIIALSVIVLTNSRACQGFKAQR